MHAIRVLTAGAIVMCTMIAPRLSSGVGDAWTQFHDDGKGNRAYFNAGELTRSDAGIVTVWMKFMSANGTTVMLFHDEIDCTNQKIRRKEIILENPSCLGGEIPEYRSSFEGKWDTLSEGLEKALSSAVCTGN